MFGILLHISCTEMKLKFTKAWKSKKFGSYHICTSVFFSWFPSTVSLGQREGVFGTDPDRNGVLEETPRSWADSYRWLSHLGIRAPYATRRKRRYEANQVWLNTTFISQGSQSWGKLADETWRFKTELIIITILHIIIITTSILNLGF